MANLFNTGITGLNAAQMGLATTGHNISNANTPGYTRQAIQQAPAIALYSGSGYVGQGTQVTSVQRVYAQFISNQVLEAQTQSSALDAYQTLMSQMDNTVADSNSGLSPALQAFFTSVQNVANNPSDSAARSSMLSSANTLVARFQSLNQQFQDLGTQVNQQIAGSVAQINSYTQQIASLNQQILVAQGNGNQPPNDLMDQRDELVNELNQQVRATVVKANDGTYNVFIGSGQAVVVGKNSYSLAAITNPADPTQLTVALAASGNNVLLTENSITGGALGGALQFRSQTLNPALNQLGQVAGALATTFNAQSQLGQDLNGALGGNFFTVPAAKTYADTNNLGTAAMGATIVDGSALTTSNYRLQYDGTNYTLTRLSDNTQQTITPGALAAGVTVDGFKLTIASGTVSAGDSFLIKPTVDGSNSLGVAISDPALIAAGVPVRSVAAVANTGNATISAPTVNTPPPPNANLQQPVTITFTSATTFDVTGTGTGNPTGLTYTAGGTITYNGWTLSISGTPQTGDTFTVSSNSGGSGSNGNALALGKLQLSNQVANGTASYQSAYSQLVSTIGTQTQSVQTAQTAQATQLQEVTTLQQSISGVNLDEEAANLLKYQQAYQASAKVMQIADNVFNSLLALVQAQ